MNRQQGLFLTFLFLFVFSTANAGVHKNKTSILLPKSYYYKNFNLTGSYYSIGTFRAIENANQLKKRYLRFKPLISLITKNNKLFYRVIVGPIQDKNKKNLKLSLISSGINDLWLIKINGAAKLIYKKTSYLDSKKSEAKSRLKSKSSSEKNKYLNNDSKVQRKINNNFYYSSGKTFSDCKTCPKQVVIPSGNFIMGEANGGLTEDAEAIPVGIPKSFSISKFEITFTLWDACLADGGCSKYNPSDEGWGRGMRPVINVNREDILSYIGWLRKKTGQLYRLPSEAEWEYASRAGTITTYWWGRKPGVNRAVCQDCGSIYDGEKTAKVGSFPMNKFGLFDTSGNVWEWVEDCYDKDAYKIHKFYPKPFYNAENSMRQTNCGRVLRGGGWDIMSMGITPSFRFMSLPKIRSKSYGFRVVREIN